MDYFDKLEEAPLPHQTIADDEAHENTHQPNHDWKNGVRIGESRLPAPVVEGAKYVWRPRRQPTFFTLEEQALLMVCQSIGDSQAEPRVEPEASHEATTSVTVTTETQGRAEITITVHSSSDKGKQARDGGDGGDDDDDLAFLGNQFDK